MNTDLRYLHLLSNTYPTVADAASEIINLEAIQNLPKSTEHFLADLHGEHEAFIHVLKNASGNIKRKVGEIFGNTIRETEKKELCTLIYYPEQKLELIKAAEEDLDDWYRITIHQLVRVCRDVSSKYTRSKVRKNLPEEFSYIIEELLHERTDDQDKAAYVAVIVDTVISTGRADDFIVAICNVIQRLAIDQLHILGDIYDRGPGAHIILDTLRQYHSWDIQWGNHDILWMGAAAGNDACICNVLRLSLRYANLATLEEGYGINMVPLATFALEVYGDDPCEEFIPKLLKDDGRLDEKTRHLIAKMHKAIAVIQFKTEAAIFNRRPEWQMNDRNLLEHIDFTNQTCTIDGKEYAMKSCHFPTISADNPNALTPEEDTLMKKLHHSFRVSEKLRKHIRTILSHGCMYTICNQNLLFHASIPLNDDGTLKNVEILGKSYAGKELMSYIGQLVRAAFQSDTPADLKEYAKDYFLYLWCGKESPLFDKSKMATFERYFLTDKSTYQEEKGNYFKLRNSEDVCDRILDAFEVTGANRHIINGHVPVHASKGENPIKAGGKLMVIDGGFSEAYHSETGIAGYTLVYHSRGFVLVQHEPFTSAQDAILRGTDIKSSTQIVEMSAHRMLVADTDKGEELRSQISELKDLLYAYRHGIIKEKRN
ncbi:fructose-1,6-bisphosphatase-3 [Prevotella communis]|uniref:Fructose-1,6-bisphosphatase class 3 n=1 Tax=Prevotella communis TaxID=2913614 RepID=A0A1H0IZI9_9BACT|nr:fructose-1,6-bisphosphatase [Prevotella communis]UKK58186.1 fructose-1,6-bisphosphatase [Prevotella communis]UKK68789.1 fructose-1,6-bisphosphatase [Prevotella communis]UKK71736.1 fructose-1,6-bisphosphatase [Prevotella communis]SDH04032.1 fructose-1,6-bisphosphatase-3 [Prevotella communis]SDO36894.1 fructose-1,6-bisphosphatase-3 [Prevotella communis]